MKPKRIVKYENMNEQLKALFNSRFKNGYEEAVMKFNDPRDGRSYSAVELETDDFHYLINLELLLKGNFSFSMMHDLEDDTDVEDDSASFDVAELEAVSEEEE